MSCVPDVSPAPVGQQGTSHARRCVDSWGSLRAGVRNRYNPHVVPMRDSDVTPLPGLLIPSTDVTCRESTSGTCSTGFAQ